jgi:hypothetical protein
MKDFIFCAFGRQDGETESLELIKTTTDDLYVEGHADLESLVLLIGGDDYISTPIDGGRRQTPMQLHVVCVDLIGSDESYFHTATYSRNNLLSLVGEAINTIHQRG